MEPRLGDDLMVGAKVIAEWLGVSQRKVFYWAETGHIPVFKVGRQWAARKSTIARHFAKLESGQAA
jgi:excisionase family DNA binding protein